ncbi:MAG: PT domain-containing protein [Anaerolineae bacterium]|nr:PT domain-containing protein [Anaerolineae bacterium]
MLRKYFNFLRLWMLLLIFVTSSLLLLQPVRAQSAASAGSLTLKLDGPGFVNPGDTNTFVVVAQGVPEPGLYGVQFELNYDATLVSMDQLQLNPNLTFVVLNTVDNTAGKIIMVASQQGKVPGLTGDVTLLSFTAVAGDIPGIVNFAFANEKMSDFQAQGFDVASEDFALSINDPATPEPTTEPTSEPTVEPTPEPTVEPTTEPTVEPTSEPTVEPTSEPTVEPTTEPTVEPTSEPTVEPTTEPTVEPTSEPTAEPTPEPTVEPATAAVIGQVILIGRAGNDWSGASVTIDDSGQSATSDSLGKMSIAKVVVGPVNSITADAPGYLSAACSGVTVTAPETTLQAVHLLSGDINGDDVVDITDATAVGAGFGHTGADLPPDITRDGILDIFDIVLVSVNFGEQGPQTWECQNIGPIQ